MTTAPTVRIRPYRAGDAPALLEAVLESVETVGAWQSWCHAGYSAADAETWVAQRVDCFEAGTSYDFVIETAGHPFAGTCSVNQLDGANRRANLGYWVRASEVRRGAATAATRQLVEWTFAHTDLVRIEIVAAVGNIASQRVAEKAGAVREGILRSRLIIHGVAHDAVVYSIVRPISDADAAMRAGR